jgi:hypothetical protein
MSRSGQSDSVEVLMSAGRLHCGAGRLSVRSNQLTLPPSAPCAGQSSSVSTYSSRISATLFSSSTIVQSKVGIGGGPPRQRFRTARSASRAT